MWLLGQHLQMMLLLLSPGAFCSTAGSVLHLAWLYLSRQTDFPPGFGQNVFCQLSKLNGGAGAAQCVPTPLGTGWGEFPNSQLSWRQTGVFLINGLAHCSGRTPDVLSWVSYLGHCFISCLFSANYICSFNSICFWRMALKPCFEITWPK